jgi:hypothetical protein
VENVYTGRKYTTACYSAYIKNKTNSYKHDEEEK